MTQASRELVRLLELMGSGDEQDVKKEIQIFDSFGEAPIYPLIEIICSPDHANLRKRAMAVLIPMMGRELSKMSQDEQNLIQDRLMSAYDYIEYDSIHIYAQLLALLTNVSSATFESMAQKFTSIPESPKRLALEMKMLMNLAEPMDIAIATSRLDIALNDVLQSLKSSVWGERLMAIRDIIKFLELFPDQSAKLSNHLSIILDCAINSSELPHQSFIELWMEMMKLLDVYKLSEAEQQTIVNFAIENAKRQTICTEMRFLPISLFSSTDELEDAVGYELADLIFEIASKSVEETEEIPFRYLDFIEKGLKVFSSQTVFDYIASKTDQYFNRNSNADKITAMTALKFLNEILPEMVAEEANRFIGKLEESAKSDNFLLNQLFCLIVSELHKYIVMSSINCKFFASLILPMLANQHPDVRLHARTAMTNIISISTLPIKGLAASLINMIPFISKEDGFQFLKVVEAAIRNEGTFYPDICKAVTPLAVEIMSSEDIAISCGGVSIASAVLFFEPSSEISVIMAHTLEGVITSGNPLAQMYGVIKIASLPNPEKIFESFSQQIESILFNECPSNPTIQQQAIVATCSIASKIGEEFSEKLLSIATSWMNSDDPSENSYGVRAICKLIPFMPSDVAESYYQKISTLACTTKNELVLATCAKKMASLLGKFPSEEFLSIACDLCLNYFRGSMNFLRGVPPISQDVAFAPLVSFSFIFYRVAGTKHEAVPQIFQFCMGLCLKGQIFNSDIALKVLSSMVVSNCLGNEALEKLRQMALDMIKEDASPILIMGISALLFVLHEKGAITDADLSAKYVIMKKWWDVCMREKAKISGAIGSLTILIWSVCFNEVSEAEIIKQTLKYVPTANRYILGYVVDNLCAFLSGDCAADVAFEGAKALAKVVSIPPRIRQKRKISESCYACAIKTLKMLSDKHPEIRQFLNAK